VKDKGDYPKPTRGTTPTRT